MNKISPEQLLGQIRTMKNSLDMPAVKGPDQQSPSAAGVDFSNLLKTTIDSVNAAQKTSSDMKMKWQQGDPNTSIAEVMIASQKADLSFRAAAEVRNKLVTAYQDIMNMPV